MKTNTLLVLFTIALASSTIAQQPVAGPAPSTPVGYPDHIPADFNEAVESAWARSVTYTRRIDTRPSGVGNLVVYNGNNEVNLPVPQPPTSENITAVTVGDNPYFSVSDERTWIEVVRRIKDANGFDTFVSGSYFQMDRLPTPVGQTTHTLPPWAVNIWYNIGEYTPIEIPDVIEAQADIFDSNSWKVGSEPLAIIRRGSKEFVMLPNWYYGRLDLKDIVISTLSSNGITMHYDLGNGGYQSRRGTYPVGLSPQTVKFDRIEPVKFQYVPNQAFTATEKTIERFGENGEWILNSIYDFKITNLPQGVQKTIKFRTMAFNQELGGVLPNSVRVRTRDKDGKLTGDITVFPNNDLWFEIPVTGGDSSVRVWASEWPEGINDIGYGRG